MATEPTKRNAVMPLATRDIRNANGMLVRDLDDGRMLGVYPLTFGCARLGIGPADCQGFDNVW